QINPHFLYNSLSIIHAKAVMARQPEISAMATALAKFYRSALNGGRDTTAIRGEVENIRAYVQIQKMLSSNDFEAEYAIDESILDEKIPNFILQPFVENAIDHGLAASEREGKRLRISVRREEGDAVFEICDNGAGMDEATLNSLFAEKATGYGIRNVDDRLRLAYGNGYSLNIQSVPGRGTRVRLRLALET
ncbi:MAG: histidine kinase, partial [Candidatus Faecivicinus sp.]|nr:histidine kinase [Candidatus Faecivicinus sp.]